MEYLYIFSWVKDKETGQLAYIVWIDPTGTEIDVRLFGIREVQFSMPSSRYRNVRGWMQEPRII